jgi:serine protease
MGKGTQPVATPHCVFEGFALETIRAPKIKDIRALVASTLGPGWRVRRFGDEPTDFEVTSRKHKLTTAQAWEATYRLRATPGIVYAEPVFAVDLPPRPANRPTAVDLQPPEAYVAGLETAVAAEAMNIINCFGGEHLDESADPHWSLSETEVQAAWDEFFPDSNTLPGAGIVIGHPDTGFRPHPEILDRLLVEQGYDFVDDDADAEDPLEGGLLRQPGHGTSTASVIISPRGAQSGYSSDPSGKAVTGVAPGAQLMPLRVTSSVILNTLSVFNVAHALEFAADHGAHVISMSLGKGLFSFRLRKAVIYAQKRGVIVCAAAGNCVGFVTWPAAFDEVIAVAASNARRKIWHGSSRGSKVDVTAPGESVWRAQVSLDGQATPNVDRSSGTSYAVAIVAGIAALWLSRHGRDNLVQRYGAEKLPVVFNQILRSSCTPVPSWEPGKFGAGLVNARATLAAPLPDGVVEPLAVAAFAFDPLAAIDKGTLDTFEHLFEEKLGEVASEEAGPARRRLAAQLAALLHTTVEQLPARLREVGQELAFHLAVNPDLYKRFADALTGTAPAAGPAAAGGVAGVGNENRENVRKQLLSTDISEALRAKVGKGH